MKITSSWFFVRVACAIYLGVTLAASAQEPPATDTTKKAEQAEPELRRIDEPAAERTSSTSVTRTTNPDGSTTTETRRVHTRRGSGEFPMGDHHVPVGGRIEDAVSIFGSTWVEGTVDGDAVSVGGDTRVSSTGSVDGAAVAVFGRLELDGKVRGEAVGVIGGVKVNSHVGGEVVAVLGGLELGPKAVVDGDVVVVGGKLKKDPSAVINGNVVNVPILGGFGDLDWLVTWFKRCVLLGRPLAFGEHLGWAWAVAGSFLAFYLLLALLFPRGIEKCAVTLETRPGYSVLTSFLTVFLTPVAIVLLAVTVIGAVLVPFVGIALFGAKLFGKAVMLAWIGRRFTGFFGDGPLGRPVFAVLIGGTLVLLLYTVPIFGFLLYKLLSWLGLGVVVYTLALAMKREKPPVPPAAPVSDPATGAVPPSTPVTMPAAPMTSAGFAAAGAAVAPVAVSQASFVPEPAVAAPPVSSGFTGPDPVPTPTAVPPPPMGGATLPPLAAAPRVPLTPLITATMPRATFMVRIAALLLDLVLIGMLVAFVNGVLPRFLQLEAPAVVLLFLAIYGAVMWKLRGTTIGGIVCGLKVVRLDNRPVDWATAWVRALSCFLSLVVAGLGFIWIAIDEEKQSWHDKIAGTVVVRVPKGVSLL